MIHILGRVSDSDARSRKVDRLPDAAVGKIHMLQIGDVTLLPVLGRCAVADSGCTKENVGEGCEAVLRNFDVTARPDQGWCGSVLTFAVEQAASDGAALAGRTVAVAVTIPGTFAEGNFTARLYVDDGADDSQRRALEQIFTGQ